LEMSFHPIFSQQNDGRRWCRMNPTTPSTTSPSTQQHFKMYRIQQCVSIHILQLIEACSTMQVSCWRWWHSIVQWSSSTCWMSYGLQ
jgi:hypothetical protein